MAIKKKELTNKEKAQLIIENGFSTKKQSTLERMKAEELDKIIELERDLNDEDSSEISDKEATKSLITQVLDFLDTYKKERTKQGISQPLKSFVIKNTENMNFVSAKIGGAVGYILASVCMAALAIDSLVGFDKLKDKLTKAKNGKDEPNNDNNR